MNYVGFVDAMLASYCPFDIIPKRRIICFHITVDYEYKPQKPKARLRETTVLTAEYNRVAQVKFQRRKIKVSGKASGGSDNAKIKVNLDSTY